MLCPLRAISRKPKGPPIVLPRTMSSQLLSVLLILTPVLAAQVDEDPKKAAEAQEIKTITSGDSEIEILPDGSRVIRTTNKQGEMVEKHIPPGDPAAGGLPELPPDEMARRGGGYFDASVMIRPRRLAPGEAGDLFVHVTLKGHTVVLPGAVIALTYEKAQGPLALGTEELMPAKPGVRETRFKGKLVWDDALTFKIPVSVRSDAKFGNAQFAGAVRLEVSDGKTGEMIGRFQAEAPGQITIGRPFPRPVPQVGEAGPKGAAARAAAGKSAAETATPGIGSNPAKGGTGLGAKATGEGHLVGEAQTTDDPGQSPGGQSEDHVTGAEPGSSLLDLAFWGVGGLLLLGLVLLVMRRR